MPNMCHGEEANVFALARAAGAEGDKEGVNMTSRRRRRAVNRLSKSVMLSMQNTEWNCVNCRQLMHLRMNRRNGHT